jgi:AcrR family transcriptional regulator
LHGVDEVRQGYDDLRVRTDGRDPKILKRFRANAVVAGDSTPEAPLSMPSSPRRTQAERVEESTRRLLEAAAELVASQGYHNTTAAQIAERAGYSRELVRARFGSKEALIREILGTEFRDRFRPDTSETSSGLAGLHAAFDRLTELAKRSPVFLRAVFVLDLEAATSIPEFRDDMRAWMVEIAAQFRRRLKEGIADGSVRADVDPSEKARELVALSVGAAYLFVLDPKEKDPGRLLRRSVDDLRP